MKIKFVFFFILLANYSLYAQKTEIKCISGDCVNGRGTLEYVKTGTILEADFTNGKFSSGTLRFKNGDIYQGHFRNQLFDSLGYFYQHAVKEYKVGFFQKDSLMNGYIFDNHTVRGVDDGKISDSEEVHKLSPALSHGLIAGDCISGDCKNGQSVWLFPDGTQLKFEATQGGYYNAQLEWTNNTTYTGELNNLTPHGLGFLQTDSANWKIGEFRNGIFINGFQCNKDSLSAYKHNLSEEQLKKSERIKEILENKKKSNLN